MAEYYLDVSAVGAEYEAYAATPTTWGAGAGDKPLPMDGNGLAGPSHAAAVAIAEIQIGTQPSDTNTLTVAGAVLTAKTTVAAKNQFAIGGTLAQTVSNLVSLINTYGTGNNQCDAVVGSGASAATLALPYFVYARVKPGATDTLQIATRVAGTTLNNATNSGMAIAHTFGTSPTITQFAGGVDGPFAYFAAIVGVFGKAAMAYGIALAAPASATSPDVTTDTIHVRTKRSGANLGVTYSTTAAHAVTWAQRSFLFDDGTVWSGDNGRFTYKHRYNQSSNSTHSYSVPSSGKVGFESRADGNFELQGEVLASSAGAIVFAVLQSSSQFAFLRSRFAIGSGHLAAGKFVKLCGDSGVLANNLMVDLSGSYCELRTSATSVIAVTANSSSCRVKCNGLRVNVIAASSPIGAFIEFTGSSQVNNAVEWIGGEVSDSNGVYSCANPFNIYAAAASTDVMIDSVAGVSDPAVGFTASSGSFARLAWNQPEGPYKGYRLETPQFSVDWKGNDTFPYANAADLRGVPWSHRVTWTSIPSPFHVITPLRLSRLYRSASAAKTITVPLYVPDATTFYLDELQLLVTYLDASSVSRTERVGGARGLRNGTRTALSAGAASWTASGVASHSAKEISLTTSQAIKQNSEIVVTLGLCASRSPSVAFYVSPELVLS